MQLVSGVFWTTRCSVEFHWTSLNPLLSGIIARELLSQMTYDLVEGLGWETIKEGYLNVKVRSKLLTSWQKLWCILRSHKQTAGEGSRSQGALGRRCVMSQYKSERDASDDLNCVARIDLRTAVDIEVSPGGRRRKKFAFAVQCVSAPRSGAGQPTALQATTHRFQCSSQEELDEWLAALRSHTNTNRQSMATYASIGPPGSRLWTGSMPNLAELAPMSRNSTSSMEVNELYQQSETTFPVEFEGSSSLPHVPPGPCLLQVTALFVNLYPSGKKNAEPIQWPLDAVRKYGSKGGQFYFESGRACVSGPGTFRFKTSQAAAEYILTRIKFASKALVAQSTRLLQDDACVGSYAPTPGAASRMTRSYSATNIFRISDADPVGPYSTTRIRNSWLLPHNFVILPNFSNSSLDPSATSTPVTEQVHSPTSYEPMYAVPSKRRPASDCGQPTSPPALKPHHKLSDPVQPHTAGLQRYEFLGANSQPGSGSSSPTSRDRRSMASTASQQTASSSNFSPSPTGTPLSLSLSPSRNGGFLEAGTPSPPVSRRPYHLTKEARSNSQPVGLTSLSDLHQSCPAARPSSQPSADVAKDAYVNMHMASGTAAININPLLRNRSDSLPQQRPNSTCAQGDGYHRLDHNSLVFDDHYRLLKHAGPDRPLKGLSQTSDDGYNHLQTETEDGYNHLNEATNRDEDQQYYHLSDVDISDSPTTGGEARGLARRVAVRNIVNPNRRRSASDSLPRGSKGWSQCQGDNVSGKHKCVARIFSEAQPGTGSTGADGTPDMASISDGDISDSPGRRRANAISAYARVQPSPKSSPKI